MTHAVIVDAIRTPGGKRNGKLKDWHPVDLAAFVLKALQERNDIDPAIVDDVVMGCVMQVGEQAANIGRNAVLAAGFPETVPGTSVDRQCGSSQQAIHFAAQGVLAGAYDVVIAAGVESMTRVPMGASVLPGSNMFGPRVTARFDLVPQGISAERIAEKWGITREENDAHAPPRRDGSRVRSSRSRSRSMVRRRSSRATKASDRARRRRRCPSSSRRSSPTAG
jgi:acetyl-CoA acyltransferase